MIRLLFAFVFVLSCGSAAAAALPPWAREAARGAPGSTEAAAVVLQDDIEVEVSEDGKIRTTRRYAVRINKAEGRGAAALRQVYIVGSGKVRELRGWVVRQDGSARELGDAHILDIAAVDNDVYNEVRVRLLNASAEIADQDVFCAEIESEARLLFAQLEWQWQERWPVRRARRMLRLPAGWQARSVTFNGPHTEPTPYKDALVWEVRDLPEIRQEPSMPPLSSVSPRLAVSFSGGGPRRIGQFETWDGVSAWLQALGDAVRRPSDVVARKAQEIAAGASSPMDRIRAVARYVQRVQYVSIQTGLGRGGGYQPRPPDLVLTRNYGDCKDKAALMRAMLAAVGIEAHLVAIFAGDRDYVREQWPSPQQFNHMIVAIAAPDAPADAAVLAHPVLGRLLVFDPTDEYTPVGELPLHEQGSLALIVAPGGGLARMPIAPPERNGVTRRIEGRLDEGGGLSVTMTERARGARASAARALRQAYDDSRFREALERRVASVLPGGRLTTFDTRGASDEEFLTSVQVNARAYLQRTGRLLLFKPPFVPPDEATASESGERRFALMLEGTHVEETVEVAVPANMQVDELPAPVTLDTRYGRYVRVYVLEAGKIVARRTLHLVTGSVPPSEHATFRDFLQTLRRADLAPVVLVQQ